MWSDPEDIETWAVSPRGAGWLFGSRVTEEFNRVSVPPTRCTHPHLGRLHRVTALACRPWGAMASPHLGHAHTVCGVGVSCRSRTRVGVAVQVNGLQLICRAHQLVQEGLKVPPRASPV
jgi:hypothetical protein